jgi:ubiquinone/menaquinone biosynthesis C-methylase UbiE
MQNQIVREQFNKQAEKFANWSVGRNVEYLNAYFEFCGIQPTDTLLDVACGPGEFTIFIARRIAELAELIFRQGNRYCEGAGPGIRSEDIWL